MNEKFDDEEVSKVYESNFGAHLFNLYTLQRGNRQFLFSKRLTIVRRMIRTMLDAESELKRNETTHNS